MAGGDNSPYQDYSPVDRHKDEEHAETLLPRTRQTWKHHQESMQDAPDTGRRSTNRTLAFLSRWRWLLDMVLLLIILGLLLERQTYFRRHDRSAVGEDITGFIPEFSSQITKFSPSETFVPTNLSDLFLDPSIKLSWLSLVPMGLGYLDLDRLSSTPDKSTLNNLPTPLAGYPSNQTVYTTSVTHQLHCLWSILEDYAKTTTGLSFNEQPSHKQRDEEMPEDIAHFHLQHCFEYLRQSILCSGDVALEGDQTTFPEGFVGSDGWDAKHVCRDWTQVRTYLEENRADDNVWIA